MHNKYAKEGFAAVSVDLDELRDKETQDKVIAFLKKQKATLTNLILDEPSDFWQKKLDIGGAPCVFVFDRDGKIVKKYDEGVDYKEIEKVVVELLKNKSN